MGKKPKQVVIRDYLPTDPIPDVFGHETPEQYDARVDEHRAATGTEVTAEVTEPPRKLEPWEMIGLTKQEWDELMIPTFLLRGHPDCTVPATSIPMPYHTTASPPTSTTPPTRTSATAPAADASDGSSSGARPNPGVTGTFDFNQYRVDPAEIESKIRAEADRRYYQWEGPHRPRKSTLLKRVRKEYYK